MLRLSFCKLLKIPYSAMRTKTSKCWTIVSLSEASPQAGLIACCSPPFSPPSSPPLSFSLLHRSHYFPRIAACCCNLWHNSLRRNLELCLNYRLFALSVSNPLMNIIYQKMLSLLNIHRYIKTERHKRNSISGQKWRNTNDYFFI